MSEIIGHLGIEKVTHASCVLSDRADRVSARHAKRKKMTALETPVLTLDTLLRRIAADLRLPDPLRALAEQRYSSVAAWLLAEGSPLATARPNIYPQGSLRIGTTVRPRGCNEFDLDLVLELQVPLVDNTNPLKLLDAVARRLRDHDTYRPMVERKNRCIRINYSGEFHLDILPGVPNPGGPPGAIYVPDCQARAWKDSNPKGYAAWFDDRTITEEQHKLMLAGLEPLPAATSVAETPPLTRAVQLIKRWRDVAYDGQPDLAPISIVLTTLSGLYYGRETSESAAIANIVERTRNALPMTGRLVVVNPTNPLEDLSERWADPKVYSAFVKGLNDLQTRWAHLASAQGLENVVSALEELFGEDVVRRALRDEVGHIENERSHRALGIGVGGHLITNPTPHRPVPKNTFYGDAP